MRAPKLLLCHGYGRSVIELSKFSETARLLGFEVICPVLPGHDQKSTLGIHDWKIYLDKIIDQVEFDPRAGDCAIGYSLGALFVSEILEKAKIPAILISPPFSLIDIPAFDKNSRRELLSHLNPRSVKEVGPMKGLLEVISLARSVPFSSSQILIAENDLGFVKNQWADSNFSVETIKNCDHSTIVHSPDTLKVVTDFLKTRLRLGVFEVRADLYSSRENQVFYEKIARTLAAGVREFTTHREIHQALDLAAGTGYSSRVLANQFPKAKWIGLDPSERMLKIAVRSGTQFKNSNLDFKKGSAENIPFENSSLDLITCSFGFHWFSQKSIQEMKRVLKPKSMMALAVPLLGSRSKKNSSLFPQTLPREKIDLLYNSDLSSRKESWCTAGIRSRDIPKIFEQFEIVKFEKRLFTEKFRDRAHFLSVMESRGSIAAMGIGPDQLNKFTGFGLNSPLVIDWKVGFIYLIV